MSTIPDLRPGRRTRLLGLAAALKAGAVVVSHLPNIRYLTGFTGSNALLLITPRSSTLFTDPRYTLQSAHESDCPTHIARGPLWPALAKAAARRRVSRLALEAEHLSHADWTSAAALLGHRVKLIPTAGLTESLRALKSPAEIDAIRRSVLLNSQALQLTLPSIRPGVTELAIAAELDHQMRILGAEAPAFETIVAAGPRSALPHARPTAQPLRNNQLLLIDMGASLEGYSSDMTRVLHLGPPRSRTRKLYQAVLEAQLAAIAAVRPGATCHDVDAAARNVLHRHNLDQYFTHSTGHGLGLEIHERPRVGAGAATPLEPGMVITIEPGAYIENYGGVRIEDTVLVTPTGVEVLTPTSKEFLVLPS